jgi:predicted DsbA family dithiol-disulfide isomerase
MGHKIELFECGCFLCADSRSAVERAKCDECTLTTYDLVKGGDDIERKAEAYGVTSCPTIVVDGKVAIVGRTSVDEVKKVLEL